MRYAIATAVWTATILLGCQRPAVHQTYVLVGTIVTPDRVITNGRIVIVGENIVAVDSIVETPAGARVISVNGLMLPGLIDLHDHLAWNALPRWNAGRKFPDRYTWQATKAYDSAVVLPEKALLSDSLGCELDRYAEAKAIVGGATSAVGSPSTQALRPGCVSGLIRNLDMVHDGDSADMQDSPIKYVVFPLEQSPETDLELRALLGSGSIRALLVHLAEGVDTSSQRELRMFKASGLLQSGTVVIHGVSLLPQDLDTLKHEQVDLVWSPRSNIELYGATTNVAAAKRLGLRIAIAPDWSPTGSSGMLNELRFAADWNDHLRAPVFTDTELVRMVTSEPARIARVDGRVGVIAPRHSADLIVLRPRARNVYESIVQSGPSDVRLVIIRGEPLYGDTDLMAELLPRRQLERHDVCGVSRAFNFADQSGGRALQSTVDTLSKALKASQMSLPELQECQ